MRGPICNCLALYGSKESEVDLKGWYDFILGWFGQIGTMPDMIGIGGAGFSDQAEPFPIGSRKLKKRAFQDIDSVGLYVTIPDYKQLVFGWRIYASLAPKNNTTLVCFDNDIAGFDTAYLKDLTINLSRYHDISYGIGYQRGFKYGPAFFANGAIAGLGFGDKYRKESDSITKWLHDNLERKSYLRGLLRDVYPFNVLSLVHLANAVEGESFSDWIAASGDRGRLEKLTGTLWLWTLQLETIDKVRKILGEHELLICY